MRRRRQQRQPWTGPDLNTLVEEIAERGRARAVRQVVMDSPIEDQDVRCNPDLVGRAYWSIEITGKQARLLYAAVLSQTGGYSRWANNWAGIEAFRGALPKTGLFWWYDTAWERAIPGQFSAGDKRAYRICVGSWKWTEMEYHQTTMGHVERSMQFVAVGG